LRARKKWRWKGTIPRGGSRRRGHDLEESKRPEQERRCGDASHHRSHDSQAARVSAGEKKIAYRRDRSQPGFAVTIRRSWITVNRAVPVPGEVFDGERSRQLLILNQCPESRMVLFYEIE